MISIQKWALAFSAASASFALGPAVYAFDESKIVPNYECQLIVYVENTEETLEQKFLSDYGSMGGHGGMAREFSKGAQKIALQASNNWMSLTWWKGEQLIASGQFVISKPSDFYRVVILRNPFNENEQVSLDCNPESAE